MSGFEARYFDGRSSAAHAVHVQVDERGDVHIHGNDIAMRLARGEVRVSARLGRSPRYLYLPDGGKCETDAHDEVDAAFARGGGIVHALERHWGLVAAAALLTASVLWVSFEYGLPTLAREIAHAVPPELESELGERSLQALDARYLKHTRLMESDRERVRRAFARVVDDLPPGPPMRLELRRSEEFGANAFALPSGIVIVTDQMVELAASDQAIMAVIAHELGHVHHRHIMRSILQNSVAAMLLATLLGDVTSVTGLAASIPTFLVEQRYSREFEFEADAFALDWMTSQGMDHRHFADVLERLGEHSGADGGGVEKYLSTHPSMRERIGAIRGDRG